MNGPVGQLVGDVGREDDSTKFAFVIASLWHPDKPVTPENLCIYTYGSEVQFGNMKQARYLRDYCDRQDPDDVHHIYRVTYEKVE